MKVSPPASPAAPAEVPPGRLAVAPYAAAVFLGAYLLFLVQPMVARMVLPWFGGSAAVWTVAMLFFQVVLLLGYLYAHLAPRAGRAFRALHVSLLLASFVVLPLAPAERWKPTGAEEPTLLLLGLLAAAVGLPYFLLSTTGPLVQALLHGAGLSSSPAAGGPYRLYALSNVGSMLALLGYPVLFEPFLTTRVQSLAWSAGYVLFATLSAGIVLLRPRPGADLARVPAGESAPREDSERRKGGARKGAPRHAPAEAVAGGPVTWSLLSATAVTLLLGVTNHVSLDVASVPFLWVLPLSLYLLTFILCFDARGAYRRGAFLAALPVAIAAMGWAFVPESLGQKAAIAVLSVGLFVCCMVCHGELHRLRPAPERLTAFYLAISAGGAAGGLFVALAAPRLFAEYDELPIGLLFLGALVLAVLRRDPESRFARGRGAGATAFALAALLAFGGLLAYRMSAVRGSSRVLARNFYGSIRVRDRDAGTSAARAMYHGVTNHGEQLLEPRLRRAPTTYFVPASGVGRVMGHLLAPGAPPASVGIVGLGTGTLATYGRPGDRFRFYEINPLVIELARSEFTFVADSAAQVEVVAGDARLSLEREPGSRFGLLVVDAFSGGAIPVHLLTVEAFELYQARLAPEGVLAVHVSNRFLDLPPVVARAAAVVGLEARLVRSEADAEADASASAWMILSRTPALFDVAGLRDVAERVEATESVRPFTDDFSNLLRIVK